MKHLLFVVTLQFLTFNLYAQSSEIGVLYQFKSSSGLVWKTFGKDKVQPKYEGEVSNGVPDGLGVLSYPFSYGKNVVGEWKVGKEWLTEHYNKEGILLGKYVKGEWILKWGALFYNFEKEGNERWLYDLKKYFQLFGSNINVCNVMPSQALLIEDLRKNPELDLIPKRF